MCDDVKGFRPEMPSFQDETPVRDRPWKKTAHRLLK
jgi:hypothetical protein